MRSFSEQRKAADEDRPLSPIVFAEIVAVDEDNRLLKILVQPWEIETGWCKCLMDTFYPIPPHKTHAHHPDPDGDLCPMHGGMVHKHDKHSPHEPKWPYKVGQEVLATVVQGHHGSEQYVVLGLIDKGPMEPYTQIEGDTWGECI